MNWILTQPLLFLFLSLFYITSSTNIKWVPGDNPKVARYSQKYWDETNMKRPEYAKTDEEIEFERKIKNKQKGRSVIMKKLSLPQLSIAIFSIGVILIVLIARKRGGNRLGSSSYDMRQWYYVKKSFLTFLGLNSCSQKNSEEERRARLKRFEKATNEFNDSPTNSEKKYD